MLILSPPQDAGPDYVAAQTTDTGHSPRKSAWSLVVVAGEYCHGGTLTPRRVNALGTYGPTKATKVLDQQPQIIDADPGQMTTCERTLVTRAGVRPVVTSTRPQNQSPLWHGDIWSRSGFMTEAPEKAERRWAELSDDVLESVEAGRKRGIEAVRKFVDEVSTAMPDESRRKTIIDAALDLTEELVTARIEFLRSVIRSAGEATSK